MKLEDQVVSLPLAKRLKELGLKQESLFYFVEFEDNSIYPDEGVEKRTHLFSKEEVEDTNDGKHRNYWQSMERGKAVDNIYSAYTVAELGEILPPTTKFYQEMNNGLNYVCKNEWATIWGSTEVDSRAKMVIYLKENKII